MGTCILLAYVPAFKPHHRGFPRQFLTGGRKKIIQQGDLVRGQFYRGRGGGGMPETKGEFGLKDITVHMLLYEKINQLCRRLGKCDNSSHLG